MFSLIITIISIALVAALALATLYYGGSAFNRGSAGAEAARLINEGQQINGAVAIARADAAAGGSAVSTLADLTTASPAYLSQLPASFSGSGSVALSTGAVTKVVSADVCTEVNKRGGHTAATAATLAATVGIYGCDTVNSVANTFFYKFGDATGAGSGSGSVAAPTGAELLGSTMNVLFGSNFTNILLDSTYPASVHVGSTITLTANAGNASCTFSGTVTLISGNLAQINAVPGGECASMAIDPSFWTSIRAI